MIRFDFRERQRESERERATTMIPLLSVGGGLLFVRGVRAQACPGVRAQAAICRERRDDLIVLSTSFRTPAAP